MIFKSRLLNLLGGLANADGVDRYSYDYINYSYDSYGRATNCPGQGTGRGFKPGNDCWKNRGTTKVKDAQKTPRKPSKRTSDKTVGGIAGKPSRRPDIESPSGGSVVESPEKPPQQVSEVIAEKPTEKPDEHVARSGFREFKVSKGSATPEEQYEINKWEYDNYGDWARSLSDFERWGAREYQTPIYRDMNNILRIGKYPLFYEKSPRIDDSIEGWKSALSKASAPEDLVAFRGIDSVESLFKVGKGDIDSIIGKTFEDKGFMSMSLDVNGASAFKNDRGAIIKINVPKGSKVGSMQSALFPRIVPEINTGGISLMDMLASNINELVAHPGHRLFVRSVSKEGGELTIEADLLGPENG
jgi:hypothetical protein